MNTLDSALLQTIEVFLLKDSLLSQALGILRTEHEFISINVKHCLQVPVILPGVHECFPPVSVIIRFAVIL
jgi:hypothetical protein